MAAPDVLSRRARRALPLMAGALAAIVVASLVYVHPAFPSSPKTRVVKPVPSPPVLSALYSATFDFVTPSNGWALVVNKSVDPMPVYLFRTTDGAKRWQQEFAGSAAQPGMAGIRFFDKDRGLIFFGFPAQLYRTIDAGHKWTQVELPPYPASSTAFSDPSHGWVLTQGPDPGLARHFFVTTNGGGSWRELPWPQWAVSGGKAGMGADLPFRGPSDGWLGAGADQPTVYSSVDAGASWQPHVLPTPSPGPGGKPIPPRASGFAFTTSVSLLPGAGVVAFVEYEAQGGAYTSFDRGRTWRALAPTPGETTYADFVFQDSTHWWAMRFGTLWKSSDAGQSWRHIGQQIDEWDYRPHVIDAKHAWAELIGSPGTRGTGLAMTADAGLHWTYVNVPKPD
jgi:photosystem II stability/assembly factor-like uncharacterized protein